MVTTPKRTGRTIYDLKMLVNPSLILRYIDTDGRDQPFDKREVRWHFTQFLVDCGSNESGRSRLALMRRRGWRGWWRRAAAGATAFMIAVAAAGAPAAGSSTRP